MPNAFPRRLHCTRINLIKLMGRRSWRQRQLWPVGVVCNAPFESRPYLQPLMTKCLVCGAQVIQTPLKDGCYAKTWPESRRSRCEETALRRGWRWLRQRKRKARLELQQNE